MDPQTVQTVAEITWKVLAGAIGAIFCAGMLYHKLQQVEQRVLKLQAEVDDMPAREAAMRDDFDLANGKMNGRIDGITSEVSHDRKEAGQFRERIAQQLGGLVTRADLDVALGRTEERIGQLIRTAMGNGGVRG